MAIQTKQQKRAAFALKEIQNHMTGEKNLVPEKLATKIVGMPNMILSNGLGQSLAFLLSKRKNDKNEDEQPEEVQIFKIVKNFFSKNIAEVPLDTSSDIKVLESVNGLSASNYIKLQDETLRMFEWLKRYARSFAEK